MMTELEKKQALMQLLADYQRHERREKDYLVAQGKNVWRFGIQTYDSPEGDVWWYGTFRTLRGETDVEILAEWSRSDWS